MFIFSPQAVRALSGNSVNGGTAVYTFRIVEFGYVNFTEMMKLITYGNSHKIEILCKYKL
jgi:hypothetical protein